MMGISSQQANSTLGAAGKNMVAQATSMAPKPSIPAVQAVKKQSKLDGIKNWVSNHIAITFSASLVSGVGASTTSMVTLSGLSNTTGINTGLEGGLSACLVGGTEAAINTSGPTVTVEGRVVIGAGLVLGNSTSTSGNGTYAGVCIGADAGLGRMVGGTIGSSFGDIGKAASDMFK